MRPSPSLVLPLLLLLAASGQAAEPPLIVVSPDEPTEADVVRVTVVGASDCEVYFYEDYAFGGTERRILLHGVRLTGQPCLDEPWSYQVPLELSPLAPGTYTVEADIEGVPYATTEFVVVPSPTELRIGRVGYFGTTFDLEMEFVHPRTGESRSAGIVKLTRDAATFWFFNPRNPEVIVKILDGTAINGHFWLFLSSMTTVEFTLHVRECVDGDPPFCEEVKSFHSAAGENLDLVDLEAF